jgi:hypothetical protein
MTDSAGFSEQEEEEFLMVYGPREVRKAMKERRNARAHTQKSEGQTP